MFDVSKPTPALFWRAFFFWLFATIAPAAQPNFGSAPDLAPIGQPDAATARSLLEKFRESAFPSQAFLEFELHALPRRGEERVYRGQLWTAHHAQGIITRVHLTDAAGVVHRWLLQNGSAAAVWAVVNQQPTRLSDADLLLPLLPDVDVSAFDLLMPYLYWTDAGSTQVQRIRGRPAYAFVFQPPEAFARAHPELAVVRAYLDTQFNVLMQAERRGSGGQLLATLSLGEIKKINDQSMLKSVDFRNDLTRNKTRLLVTGVALKLDLPASIFEPARLAEELAPPRANLIERLAP